MRWPREYAVIGLPAILLSCNTWAYRGFVTDRGNVAMRDKAGTRLWDWRADNKGVTSL